MFPVKICRARGFFCEIRIFLADSPAAKYYFLVRRGVERKEGERQKERAGRGREGRRGEERCAGCGELWNPVESRFSRFRRRRNIAARRDVFMDTRIGDGSAYIINYGDVFHVVN